MKFYINKILLVLFILDTHDLFSSPISSGFYTGVTIGMEGLRGHRDDGLHTNPLSYDPQIFSENKRIKEHGHIASIFGGYLYRHHSYGIGGEGFFEAGKVANKIDCHWIDNQDIAMSNNKGHYLTFVEKKNSFGFKVLLGGIFKENFVYLLFGSSMTQFRYSANVDYTVDFPSFETYPTEKSIRKLACSFDYGLGIQHQTGSWKFGVEAYCRRFKNQLFTFALNPDLDPSPIVCTKVKPFIQGLSFKLAYAF